MLLSYRIERTVDQFTINIYYLIIMISDSIPCSREIWLCGCTKYIGGYVSVRMCEFRSYFIFSLPRKNRYKCRFNSVKRSKNAKQYYSIIPPYCGWSYKWNINTTRGVRNTHRDGWKSNRGRIDPCAYTLNFISPIRSSSLDVYAYNGKYLWCTTI